MDLPVRSHSPIKAARRRQGITQRELAELAGVSQSLISNLEAGLSVLDHRVLEALRTLGEDAKSLKRGHRKHLAATARRMKGKAGGGSPSANPVETGALDAWPLPASSKPKKDDAG